MTLETEYNNRERLPAYQTTLDAWARDAEAFRAQHAHAQLNVSYGPTERQRLDLFWPDAQRKAPVAMFIHGGYWQALDRSSVSHMARGLNARGVAVAIPSYDLCPYVKLTEIIAQMRRATIWLARHTQKKLLAMGHSAGGHLAAMLMATDWTTEGLPADTVPLGLPISGLFELSPLIATTLNDKLRLHLSDTPALSPVRFPAPAHRGLCVAVGANESGEFLRQSRDFARAWGGELREIPGADHLTVLEGLTNPDSDLVVAAQALLQRI